MKLIKCKGCRFVDIPPKRGRWSVVTMGHCLAYGTSVMLNNNHTCQKYKPSGEQKRTDNEKYQVHFRGR